MNKLPLSGWKNTSDSWTKSSSIMLTCNMNTMPWRKKIKPFPDSCKNYKMESKKLKMLSTKPKKNILSDRIAWWNQAKNHPKKAKAAKRQAWNQRANQSLLSTKTNQNPKPISRLKELLTSWSKTIQIKTFPNTKSTAMVFKMDHSLTTKFLTKDKTMIHRAKVDHWPRNKKSKDSTKIKPNTRFLKNYPSLSSKSWTQIFWDLVSMH